MKITSVELKKILKSWADIMLENKEYLIDLDSVVGDGDLGLTMSDGFIAASKMADSKEDTDIGMLLYHGGKAMSTAVPSTMGTLMASGLMAAGKALKGSSELDNSGVVTLFQSYFDGVAARGKAKVGDKTFLDGMIYIINSLNDSISNNLSDNEMLEQMVQQAEEGFNNTKTMLAVHGRAATRGEESRTLLDPGAAVALLLAKGFQKAMEA